MVVTDKEKRERILTSSHVDRQVHQWCRLVECGASGDRQADCPDDKSGGGTGQRSRSR